MEEMIKNMEERKCSGERVINESMKRKKTLKCLEILQIRSEESEDLGTG